MYGSITFPTESLQREIRKLKVNTLFLEKYSRDVFINPNKKFHPRRNERETLWEETSNIGGKMQEVSLKWVDIIMQGCHDFVKLTVMSHS